VVDASAHEDDRAAMMRAVEDVLEEIGAGERPRLLVLNKVDLLDELGRVQIANANRDAIMVSGVTGEGLEELRERIDELFVRRRVAVELLLPYAEGARLAELHELAGELEREERPEGVRVRALLEPADAVRFARFAVRAART
jgi:GTP-binding protein HflX